VSPQRGSGVGFAARKGLQARSGLEGSLGLRQKLFKSPCSVSGHQRISVRGNEEW